MPRKHVRTRVRSRNNVIRTKDNTMVRMFSKLQSSTEWTRWDYRTISQRQAELMEAAGEAERIHRDVDGLLELVGWQQTAFSLPSKASPTTLTWGNMEAVANAASSRPRLSPAERRQVEKVLIWPLIGDTKAVAVRSRISDADRRKAEALLAGRAA